MNLGKNKLEHSAYCLKKQIERYDEEIEFINLNNFGDKNVQLELDRRKDRLLGKIREYLEELSPVDSEYAESRDRRYFSILREMNEC